jgi:hypothetical protein
VLLGWAASGDAQTRGKDRGPREDFAVLGQQANGLGRRPGGVVSFSFLLSYFYFLFKASKHI